MKSSIFIPNKINVGFQNRNETYTGKLAYVIYYDEKGKLRKETSWNSWRDKTIPNEEFENVPTEGFVLNKKVGDYDNGWSHRHAYCRVYDPRNFEFEITIENLLFILENTNSIKGKGLEGEFVYGWDGKDLVLLPVDSPDYKEISKYNEIIHSNSFVKAKDLKLGATYIDQNKIEYVYMGRFDYYDYGYWKDDIFFKTYKKMNEYCEKNNIPKTKNKTYFGCREVYEEDKYGYGKYDKRYCFCYKGTIGGTESIEFIWKQSLSKFLTEVLNENPNEEYARYFEMLERNPNYSPPDETKTCYLKMTYEEFYNNSKRFYRCYFFSDIRGEIECFYMKRFDGNDLYVIETYPEYGKVIDVFPTEEKRSGLYSNIFEKRMIPVTIQEIFEKMQPRYKQTYLQNGNKYLKEYN